VPVPQTKSASDATLERLHELKDRLTECLVDAEDIRARIAEARDANAWPDLGPAARLFVDYNDRRRAR